jgi:hypothetical protein
MSERQTAPNELDAANVGIGFVDVLFALVIAQAFNAIDWNHLRQITAGPLSSLVVAIEVTLLSWIGYHNSRNKAKAVVRIFNLQLLQFVIDILLVFDYWLLVTSAGVGPIHNQSGQVTAMLVFVSFTLYLAWDFVSARMAKSSAYGFIDKPTDSRYRRRSTFMCWAATAVLFLVTFWWHDRYTSVIVINVCLGLIAILFRWRKDRVPKPALLS